MVCFGIWGAFGNVSHEDRTFAPRQITAEGTWLPVRYRGPCDYEAWRKSWNVFEAAMIMLGAAAPSAFRTSQL